MAKESPQPRGSDWTPARGLPAGVPPRKEQGGQDQPQGLQVRWASIGGWSTSSGGGGQGEGKTWSL